MDLNKDKDGSNYLLKRFTTVEKSPSLAMNERQNAAKGRIVKFGFGESPFPVEESVVKVNAENAWRKSYLNSQGLQELRASISEFLEVYCNVKFHADNILIAPGSKMLLYTIQQVFDGSIVIPSPAWTAYRPQSDILSKSYVTPQMNYEEDYKLQPYHVEKLYEENKSDKLFIFNQVNCPTGQIYNHEELKELAKVFRKHKSIVLSDEIYNMYDFSGMGKTPSLAQYYKEGTIITNGIAKWANAGGYRVGFAAIPDELKAFIPALTNIGSEIYSCATASCQYAAIRVFQSSVHDPVMKKYISDCGQILKVIGLYCAKRIRAMGGTCLDPQGGFYVFPDFSELKPQFNKLGIYDGVDFTNALADQYQVFVNPGKDVLRPNSEFSCRLAFLDINGKKTLEEVNKGAKIDENFVLNHCPNIVYGMNQMEKFFQMIKSA